MTSLRAWTDVSSDRGATSARARAHIFNLIAHGVLKHVGPSPAGCPMYWYTTPSAVVSSRRHGDARAAGTEGSSRDGDGVGP